MLRFRPVAAAAALSVLPLLAAAPAQAASCELTFRIGTSTPMSTASVFAIYLNAPGDFPGSATGVQCQLLNNTLGQISDGDQPQVRTLTVTLIGTPSPIQGPKDVAKCTWIPTSRFPTAGDFNLNSQSGFNTAFPIPGQVNPQFTISKIDCTGTVSTTTTTTSSTTTTSITLPPVVCGDFDGNGKVGSSDALAVLRSSVGLVQCQDCVCDVDGNGKKSAADALLTLRVAVGTVLQLLCPNCN